MARDVTVLVVEGNEAMQRVLQQTLRPRYTVLTASCWNQAHEIRSHAEVDVVVLDVNNLTDPDRLGVDELCLEADRTPIVLLANSSREPAGNGRARSGPLMTFPARPVSLRELHRTLEEAVVHKHDGREPERSQSAVDESNGILAQSVAMRNVMALIDRAAQRDTPILLIGESGTGKELLARAVHKRSPRTLGPFVAVNCSAIPETLLESELFGHRRGAFTDARDDQRGLFQSAQRGTIFLDEIGDMAPALQGKLLRVLQEKEVHPLGAPAPVPTDVRIITATHRDLTTLVAEGKFREDLLYRINVIEVRVPPLRERPDDLEPLIHHLLRKYGKRLAKPGCTVSAEAMVLMRQHAWPGNVREVENVIERALVLGTGTVIDVEDLPDRLRDQPAPNGCGVACQRLADVEREHILRTLRAVKGNKAAAARVLGLNRKTLYRKLTQHRIPAAHGD
ncbi:MAG TPA: sigma-54 dependent transcriptional regulator [Vicinamibacterales bacterium]|nr:sigma-54 dependent transcriptional regulator [Vicinamibacterales bacterium]